MAYKYNIASATLCALLLSSNAVTLADPTSKAKRAMDKARMEQNIKNLLGRNTANLWEDASRAPSDFPVKLFLGNQTKFMRMDILEQGMSSDSKKYGRHMTLRTRDPAPTVVQWFKSSLQQSGFKLNDKYSSPASSVNMYSIYAESDKMAVVVAAVPQDDAGGPACQFQVNVTYKEQAK